MELKFLASYILILIALYYSYRQNLGLERKILIDSLRAFIQLLILGYLLVYIFQLTNPAELLLILFFMVLFASYTAQRRVYLVPRGSLVAFLSIFFSSFIVLFSLMLFHIISFKPNEIIPVGGMVLGNSLNIYTLVVDRMKGEVKNTTYTIESMVALGASLKEALHIPIRASIRASFIPVLNSLQTVGIVHIPGITTGMLLAGAEPLKAISYQLAILYMIVAVALFTGYFTVVFSYKRIISTVTPQRIVSG